MLNDDYELTREDIQDLSNRDVLAAFFAKLGYDTNERLVQNSPAMGFTGELLKSSVTHIERLASQDGGLLEVYLVELKSVTVTVAVTRALAQAFRNLNVQQPLLVLTDDYQRLDFVLVERYSALSTAAQKAAALVPALSPAAGRLVGVRPRVLTVNRTNPGAVALRVLRRFSYTESDSFAQTDKLLSAYYLETAKILYPTCLEKHDQQCVLGFVDHHLTRESEESDVVHDLLAFLAEEMIRLNKQKRAAQREFLDWLVETLRILPDKDGRRGLDALTGKAKLSDYPGDYHKGEPPLAVADLLEILRKNKSRLGVSLSDTALLDRVGRVYEDSLARVLPLKETLRKTDALLDAVVYRLYGLTEEEVRVVEGRI